jgi:pyruvate/2-oxoglutarate dehydrogenase complex dihydrolipoamide dehydrogenase (E3) component
MQYDFDLAVIGAGTGGLVSAFVADSLGARVALIEADKVGGECLWSGCVPSKTLVRSAKVFDLVKRSEEFGVHIEKPRLVWNAVRLRVADVRDEIKKGERDELAKTKIEQIIGRAKFTDAQHLEIETKGGTRQISAKKFILATGSSARIPDIEGWRKWATSPTRVYSTAPACLNRSYLSAVVLYPPRWRRRFVASARR